MDLTYSDILELSIIPGMSDREAVAFHINIAYKLTPKHKVALYHEHIKRDIFEFQTTLLPSDLFSRPIEQNWSKLRQAINTTVSKMCHTSCTSLPWINRQIKKDMRTRKHLCDIAKQSNFRC